MRKLKYFGWLVLFLMIPMTYQNCSPTKSSNENDVTVQNLSSNATEIRWRYTSGSVAPNYYFDILYSVDFQTQRISINAQKGFLVVGQPNSGIKFVTLQNINQIKYLLDQIRAGNCQPGPLSIGGGIDSLMIFTTSTTSEDKAFYLSDCFGDTRSNAYKINSGYVELTNYIKSL